MSSFEHPLDNTSEGSIPYWQWLVRLVACAYTLALFTLTHIPIPPRVAAVASTGWDKAFHVGAYAGLAVLMSVALLSSAKKTFPVMPLLMGLFIFAGLDEILQGPVGRTPDTADWLADSLGVVLGLAVSLIAMRCWSIRETLPEPLFLVRRVPSEPSVE